MKVFAVIEIVRDNEGNPGIHLHRTALGAAETVRRLNEENGEIGIDDEDVFIVEQEIEIED